MATLHLGPTDPPRRLESPSRGQIAGLSAGAKRLGVARAALQTPAARLTPSLSGRLDDTRGAALSAAIAALPPERRALGIAGLTVEEIQGAPDGPSLCEAPHLLFETEAEGVTYAHRYEVPPVLWMHGLRLSTYALPETCVAAIRAAAGALDGVVGQGCEREDLRAHLPPDSTCRACLEEDGDHARCVSAGACAAEATRQVAAGRNTFFDVAEATALACAPDLRQSVFLLLNQGEAARLPDPYEPGRIAYSCRLHWTPSIGTTDLYCNQSEGVGIALSDVLVARVQSIRPAGDERPLYAHRLAMTGAPVVDGQVFDVMPVFPNQLAELSVPIPRGGWGLDPRALRPGGVDPAEPRDTFAPDWIAAVALKTATRTDLVPIGVYGRNLCGDADWEGPDAQGRFHCGVPPAYFERPPEGLDVWMYDWTVVPSANGQRLDIMPLVTLGATGEMDLTIPGGHVPRVLGTPTLADPEWEACAWPEMFVPDEISIGDSAQSPAYTYTGQTWRFGGHPELDLRLVLATNWRRAFCFQALDPAP